MMQTDAAFTVESLENGFEKRRTKGRASREEMRMRSWPPAVAVETGRANLGECRRQKLWMLVLINV